MTALYLALLPLLFHALSASDVCPNSLIKCPDDQNCCVVNALPSCCPPSPAKAIGVTVGVIVAICLVSTFVGICLYLKKRVHKDTAYSVDDIEHLYIKSLKKQVSFGGETDLCANCTPKPGTPGFDLPGTPIVEQQYDELGNPIPTPGLDGELLTDEKNTETASTQDKQDDVPENENFPRGLTAKKAAAKGKAGAKGAPKGGAKSPAKKPPAKKKKSK